MSKPLRDGICIVLLGDETGHPFVLSLTKVLFAFMKIIIINYALCRFILTKAEFILFYLGRYAHKSILTQDGLFI